jgi:hypothetical protein
LRFAANVAGFPRMRPSSRFTLPLLLLVLARPMTALTAAEAPASPPPQAPASSSPALPVGEVKPAPEGCLAVVFFAPGDEKRVLRNSRGRITDVLSTKGHKEPVLARISVEQLEELVPRIAEIVAGGDPEPISHIPGFYSQGHIPGPAAWEYLQRYLKDDDELWTYGEGETGLLVIRANHLLCMMQIKVPFEDPATP